LNRTLAQRLADRIRREGPITFRDWMESALYEERVGYYQRTDIRRWGRSGDYRTSPETSVLFAAVFARFFANVYDELGAPPEFTIVEVGGGTGEFAATVLETLREQFPQVINNTRYVFDDISSDSLERAAEKLSGFEGLLKFSHLHERDRIETGVIFSNELFDAFPVHRVGMFNGRLVEFYVAVGEAEDFKWVTGELSTPRLLAYFERFNIQLSEGQIIEINLEMEEWFRQAADKLQRGYVVTVDYGAEALELYGPGRCEGTLRAFRGHQFATDVLEDPGSQDITTSVDWTAAMDFGHEFGFVTERLERQDRFLMEFGLLEELERRAAAAVTEAERVSLRTGVREMILPGGLAQSFQVLLQRKL
jgi:SAM-dependent MidA family methyltransferase